MMGSYVYAARCRRNQENIEAMISFDGVGFYSDAVKSQRFPFPINVFYPSTGNFISFVGNRASARLVRRAIGTFREHAQFPSQGAAVPGSITGVDWSDHWSFWEHGYPAIMVTDTLPFRYDHYHLSSDTHDRIDYERMARVVEGMRDVVADLVR